MVISRNPPRLGDWVWFDENNDGIQDAGENPLANYAVDLTITWPDLSQTVLHTTSDANGRYSFGNLLQDERYDGSGPGEPVFTLSAPILSDMIVSPADATSDDLDSDSAEVGGSATISIGAPNSALVKGYTNVNYDFGFAPSPTALTVSSPVASASALSIVVNWQTYSEMDVLDFSLYRAADPNASPAERALVDQQPAKHPGKPLHDNYQYLDGNVRPGVAYTYWLVVRLKDGAITMAPTSVNVSPRIYLPSIQR